MSYKFSGVAPTEEQAHVMQCFVDMLLGPSADGGVKRETAGKPDWRVDPGHVRGLFSHVGRWADGELEDPDSGSHPLVHAAWRALAIAWQERHAE